MKLKITAKKRTIQPEENTIKKCPMCGSTDIIYDPKRGEYVCKNCGYVISENEVMDMGERMDFTKKFGARVGAPQNPLDKISHGATEIDTKSKNISTFMRRRIGSMRRANYFSSQNSKDRNWKIASQAFDRYANILNLHNPVVMSRAKKIYKEILMKGVNRGMSIEKSVLASILLAAKIEDYALTIDDIVKATGVKKRDINSVYKKIKRALNITQQEIDISITHYIEKVITAYMNHPKYRREAKEIFTPEVVLLAKKIGETAHALGISSGKKRISIAVASIYLAIEAFGKNVPQSHISEISGVTEVTIRNRSRDIRKKVDIEALKKETIEELYGDEEWTE